jgi:DNA-binding transcriptional regulator YbjK
MDFEQFKEFMQQSATQQDARIAQIEEAIRSLASTSQRLADNQICLQDRVDEIGKNSVIIQRQLQELSQEMRELGRIVFRHVTGPKAHESLQ